MEYLCDLSHTIAFPELVVPIVLRVSICVNGGAKCVDGVKCVNGVCVHSVSHFLLAAMS